MTSYLDPQSLGLAPRTVVEVVDSYTIAIVIKRKSRIIMTDGQKILAKAEKIKRAKPGSKIILKTSAPVCGKTLQFLADNNIEIDVLTKN
jgi:hypothetical protein